MAATDYTSVAQALYVSYFGRPADPIGLINFSAQLNAIGAPTTVQGLENAYYTSAAIKALVDSFGSSAESTSLYSGTSSIAFINSIYSNVLGRNADFEGLIFWSNAIDNGSLTKGNAALAIAAGALSNTSAQGLVDAAVINNKIAVATSFTESIDTASEIISYSGNQAAAQARSFLSTVTTEAPGQSVIQSTLFEIVNYGGLGTPPPVAVTNTINDYATTNQITLGADFTTASPQSGAVPGYFPDVLSYAISNSGEIRFTGTFANSLTPEQKAGNIVAILKNMPGTACSFIQYNNKTLQNDTYLVCTGTGTTNLAVIDIVGVAKHGVASLQIQVPMPVSTTFDVVNNGGSLSYTGTAVGDISFDVDSSGIATFTRQGVEAPTTLSVSAFSYSPSTIYLSDDISNLSTANATALEWIIGFDANGHTYTVLDTIASANGLNFTTSYPNNAGVNLSGSAGSQSVTGSSSNDTIYGGDAADTIAGGAGNDFITGGAGPDLMVGGADIDTFQVGYRGDSEGTTARTSGGSMAAGDTLVFGNGVDTITEFAASDLLDTPATPGVSPTSLLGQSYTGGPLTLGTSYVAYGTFNNVTHTFVVAAGFNAVTSNDALVVAGDSLEWLQSTTGYVVLENIAVALTGANFV